MLSKKDLEYELEKEKEVSKDAWKYVIILTITILIITTIVLIDFYINFSVNKSKIIPQEVCVNDSSLYVCNESGMITGVKIEYNKEVMNVSISACELVKETIKNCSMQKEVCENGVCQVRYRT